MVNDIMHMFSSEFMATHSVCGGNAQKEALDQDLVLTIIGKIYYENYFE